MTIAVMHSALGRRAGTILTGIALGLLLLLSSPVPVSAQSPTPVIPPADCTHADQALTTGDYPGAGAMYAELRTAHPRDECVLNGLDALERVSKVVALERSGASDPGTAQAIAADMVVALIKEPHLRVPSELLRGQHLGNVIAALSAQGLHDALTAVVTQALQSRSTSVADAVAALGAPAAYRLAAQLDKAGFHADAVTTYKETIKAFPQSTPSPVDDVDLASLDGGDHLAWWDYKNFRRATGFVLLVGAGLLGLAVVLRLLAFFRRKSFWRQVFVGYPRVQVMPFEVGSGASSTSPTTAVSPSSTGGAPSPTTVPPAEASSPSPVAPPGLAVLTRSYMRQLTTSSGATRIDLVDGDAQPLELSTDVVSMVPALKFVDPVLDILRRLSPMRQLRISGQVHGPTAKGVGLTMRMTDQRHRVRNETTFWSTDYNPDAVAENEQPAPAAPPTDAVPPVAVPAPTPAPPTPAPMPIPAELSPYLCLISPAAVWTVYQLTNPGWRQKARNFLVSAYSWWRPWQKPLTTYRQLGTSDPRSYALFAAGSEAQERGNARRAIALYQGARDVDPDNVPAAINYAILVLRCLPKLGKNEDVAKRIGDHAIETSLISAMRTAALFKHRRCKGDECERRECQRDRQLTAELLEQRGQQPSDHRISKREIELSPYWYSALYTLAVHKMPPACTKGSATGNLRAPDTQRAEPKPPKECGPNPWARLLVIAVEQALSKNIPKRLRLFLETMEVSAIILLAAALLEDSRGGAGSTKVRVELRTALAAENADHQYDSHQLIAYVEQHLRVDYRGHYNLACYHSRLAAGADKDHQEGEYEKALGHLLRGLSPTDPDLRRWSHDDPSLQGLRDSDTWKAAKGLLVELLGDDVVRSEPFTP